MQGTRIRNGYTLVEIPVVLAVVLVVAAVLLPVLFRARGSARSVTCISNLRQIGLALQMYQSDNSRMPVAQFVDSEYPGWRDPLLPYTHSGAVYHCPEAQPGLAGNYEYRGALSLTEPISGQPVADDAKTILLSPSSVTVICHEHSKITPQHTFDGAFNILRADGSARTIPGGRAAYWIYNYRTREWIPPPGSSSALGRILPVFPDEPWPPQFEQ